MFLLMRSKFGVSFINHHTIYNRFTSHEICMKKTSHLQDVRYLYSPKTENQKLYVDSLNNDNNDIIVVTGPAGSGKTMFACLSAIELLKKNVIRRIILTRPIVSVEEEELGFLPGNIVKKMDPWTRPILDIFMEYYSQTEINQMIANGIIEISPLAYMRGRTFKHAFIIADEMQNSSPNQMLMLTTRIGTNSRMVITGDLAQSDKSQENGLKDLISRYDFYMDCHKLNDTMKISEEKNKIEIVRLNNTDILRSEVVEKILRIYDWKDKIKKNSRLIEEKKDENKGKGMERYNDAAMIPRSEISGSRPFIERIF